MQINAIRQILCKIREIALDFLLDVMVYFIEMVLLPASHDFIQKWKYCMEYEHIRVHFNPHPTLLKFDRRLPGYSWLFSFDLEVQKIVDTCAVLPLIEPDPGTRALSIYPLLRNNP